MTIGYTTSIGKPDFALSFMSSIDWINVHAYRLCQVLKGKGEIGYAVTMRRFLISSCNRVSKPYNNHIL